MDLKELGSVNPQRHWYFQSKLAPLVRDFSSYAQIPLLLVDIGAGDGYFSRNLVRKFGGHANCVDINYKSSFKETELTFSKFIEFKGATSIIFIDVLEHVDSPLKLLHDSLAQVEVGCLVAISVPAFRVLWSGHDKSLGHVDRYRTSDVHNWIASLDGRSEIIRSHYLFSVIFPLVFLYRKLDRRSKSHLREVSSFINRTLLFISKVDNLRIRNPFFGLSAYVLFRYFPNR